MENRKAKKTRGNYFCKQILIYYYTLEIINFIYITFQNMYYSYYELQISDPWVLTLMTFFLALPFVFYVSITGFGYFNFLYKPFKEIVINYQNGGD
jgi:hypothetical protein